MVSRKALSILAVGGLFSVVGVSVACGAPDSFDNLVGAAPADGGIEADAATIARGRLPDLAAPRPVAPLAASIILGSRPLFRWDLTPPLTGARLELCRDAVCAGETKTFDAKGTSFQLTEDLAPGMWFWRVYGTTDQGFGATPSNSRAMLIRGGPHVPSAVGGSFVDIDGNGMADLVVVTTFPPAPLTHFELTAYLARNGDSTDFVTEGAFGDRLVGIPVTKDDPPFVVCDVDGDGFGDITLSDDFGSRGRGFVTVFGSGLYNAESGAIDSPQPTPIDSAPGLRAAGDYDGDGYADIVYADPSTVSVMFGTKLGLGPIVPLATDTFADAGAPPPYVPFASGFAQNDDPYADVVFATIYADSPIVIVRSFRDRTFDGASPKITGATITPPTSFVTGDFDGDGLSDIALTTTAGGKATICLTLAAETEGPSIVVHCHTPDTAPAGFGSSLTTVDLEGDGKDELLVGSTSDGITALHLDGTTLRVDHLPGPYGTLLTTILPGWLGQPGTWAATRPDAQRVGVFKGTQLAMEIAPHPEMTGFGRALR